MFQDDYFKYCTSRWKLNQLQAKQPAAPTTPGVALLPHRDAATLVVNGKGPSGLTHLRGQRVFSGGGKENKISWNVEMSYYIIYIYYIYILSSSTSKHKFSAFTQKDMIGRTKKPWKSIEIHGRLATQGVPQRFRCSTSPSLWMFPILYPKSVDIPWDQVNVWSLFSSFEDVNKFHFRPQERCLQHQNFTVI
jgi:hypothetical protein